MQVPHDNLSSTLIKFAMEHSRMSVEYFDGKEDDITYKQLKYPRVVRETDRFTS